MHSKTFIRNTAAAVICGVLLVPVARAEAVSYGASNAYNLGTSIPVLGGALQLIHANPLNASAGVAPLPYSYGHSVFDFGVSPIVSGPDYRLSLSTGLLQSWAGSNVDGADGTRLTEAWTRTDALGFDLQQFFSSKLLSFDASVLSSSARITGQPGAFSAAGNTQMLGTRIDSRYLVGPLTIDTDNLMANWKIIDQAGLTVTLNRQLSTCGNQYCDLSVDAIHVSFNNYRLDPLNLLNGELAFGHSYAVMAVPEASTYGMMLAGLGLVGLMTRRRTR